MTDVYEHLLKYKSESYEYTEDEINNFPDTISEFETKQKDTESHKSNYSSSFGSIKSRSSDTNIDLSHIHFTNSFLPINDYSISLEQYHTKLERPYLLAKKKSQFSNNPIRHTFCYRIITNCLSLHKIVDSIKPYFGLSEYGMLITKIENKSKIIRLGILTLSKSVLDAPTRLNSSMYLDMTSLPIEIIMEQYGINILNCIRSVFAFREIIGFKTPNSGESLTKGGIFFDYKTADEDIEKKCEQLNLSKYILTFPETLSFGNKTNDSLYTKRVISKKYIKKFFGTDEKYTQFLKDYVKLLNLDTLKENLSKTIKEIDNSYQWFVHYVLKRISTIS